MIRSGGGHTSPPRPPTPPPAPAPAPAVSSPTPSPAPAVSSPAPSPAPAPAVSSPAPSPAPLAFAPDTLPTSITFSPTGTPSPAPLAPNQNTFDQEQTRSQNPIDSVASSLRSALSRLTSSFSRVSAAKVGPLTDEIVNRRALEAQKNEYATHFTSHQDPNRESRVYPDSMNSDSFHREPSTPGGSLPIFHGTTREGAHNIRENGFRLNMKTDGAAAATKLQDDNTSQYHFFTKEAWIAKELAQISAGFSGDPAVVKVHLPREYRDTLEPDPGYPPHRRSQDEHAFMSKYDTPAEFIQETRNVPRLPERYRDRFS